MQIAIQCSYISYIAQFVINFSLGCQKKVGEDASFGAIFILMKTHNVVNVFICLEHKKCVEMSMD